MSIGRRSILIAVLTILVVPLARPAHAYLDPGTGSMILQVALGGVAGILVAARLYWRRLMRRFGSSSREDPTPDGATDAERD